MINLFHKNKSLKSNLSVILLVAVIFPSLSLLLLTPRPTQALPGDIVYDPAVHSAITAQTAIHQANAAAERVAEATLITNETTQSAIKIKEEGQMFSQQTIAIVTELVLHQILNMLTNEIIKWIQGDGEPKFITDWQGFLKDAVDSAGGIFVDQYLGQGWLCDEFDIDIKIALQDVPRFEDRVRCSLSDIGANITDFANDFSKGGWKGWIELTKPNNNFYGAFLFAQEEKLSVEEAAKKAAEDAGIAGGGFTGDEVCSEGYIKGTKSTCFTIGSCESLSKNATAGAFVCSKKVIKTPGAIVSDLASRASSLGLDRLSSLISTQSQKAGPFAPYITAITDALINRVMKEGLAFVTSLGPTSDNPNIPLPASVDVPTPELDPLIQLSQGQLEVDILKEQLDLLKQTIEDDLYSQQNSNMSVSKDIQIIQESTLETLAEDFLFGCDLNEPASVQSVTGNVTKITYPNIGNITIDDGFDPYLITEINTEIDGQINILQNNIDETNQKISDATSAAAAINGYIQAVDDYLILYRATLQPATTEEQAALDVLEQAMNTAKNIFISASQEAIGSSSDTITGLTTDAQKKIIEIVLEADSLVAIRGSNEENPEPGTLYEDKQQNQQILDDLTDSSCR